MLSTKMILL